MPETQTPPSIEVFFFADLSAPFCRTARFLDDLCATAAALGGSYRAPDEKTSEPLVRLVRSMLIARRAAGQIPAEEMNSTYVDAVARQYVSSDMVTPPEIFVFGNTAGAETFVQQATSSTRGYLAIMSAGCYAEDGRQFAP